MPVYEEKLISPLAVRFSQEHVRSTFRNGMNLEAAVGLVEVQTFQGPKDPQSPHNYDLLLKPPFPNIEIVRWAPGMRNKQSIPMESMQHWYTKDNRRLYVLQRAATKYWPKKVAVEADVLFAVPNGLRKKYDSSTAGLLVALGDSGDFSPSTLVWHWGHAVTDLTGKDVNMAKEKSAFQQLKQDDLSSSLDQLVSLATGRRFDPLHKLPGFSSDSASASSEPEEVAEVAEVAEVGKADKARKETVSQEKQEKQEKGQQGQRGKGMKGGKKGMKEEEPVKVTEEHPKNIREKVKNRKKNKRAAKAKEIEESDESSDSSELDWSQWWPDFDEHWERVTKCLDGVWKGPKGETYQMWFEEPGAEEVRGYCTREQKKSSKTFSVRHWKLFQHVSERFLLHSGYD